MKNKLFILFFFVFSVSFSQNITFVKVLNLKNKSLSEVKKYLKDENWEIMHYHFSKEHKFGDIRFSFDNKNPDRQIPLFITFYYEGQDLMKNRIEFEISKKEIFDEYLAQFKTLDFKLTGSKTDRNQTVETYKNDTTTINVKTIPVANYYGKQQTFYKFYITDNTYKPTEYYKF
ncbi:hypothetical protein NAT51_18105 [Flavobacterium amniphilum]|uniref:hypothetical protein n=1 Tax=Flavobacterium amniphilum TaxID=1834035 RepID=UPI00202A27C1|nr:hypothetical protein [Flavobacterium amniphilum]MCL9807446.1 hypothetical protein [Flavobacterium amniphilum]